MKGMSILIFRNKTNDSSTENISQNEKEQNDYQKIGDIDELIFPDDEPRYISER